MIFRVVFVRARKLVGLGLIAKIFLENRVSEFVVPIREAVPLDQPFKYKVH